MRRALRRLSPSFRSCATKCDLRPWMIFFSLRFGEQINEPLLARYRLAEPGGSWPPSACALAQLVHRNVAAGMRAADHAARLWRRSGPADWHVVLARCAGG